MPQSDYPIFGGEIARARKRFQHPLLINKLATMTQSGQTTTAPNCHKAMKLSCSKIKWWAIYTQIYQKMPQLEYPILGVEIARAKKTYNYDTEFSKPPSLPIAIKLLNFNKLSHFLLLLTDFYNCEFTSAQFLVVFKEAEKLQIFDFTFQCSVMCRCVMFQTSAC